MTKKTTKAVYQTPALVEYGSVRNLTGGSMGGQDDGGGTQRAMR